MCVGQCPCDLVPRGVSRAKDGLKRPSTVNVNYMPAVARAGIIISILGTHSVYGVGDIAWRLLRYIFGISIIV